MTADDELEVEYPASSITDFVLLRVVRAEVPLRREGKFWVYRGGDPWGPADVAGLVPAAHDERSEAILPGSTSPLPIVGDT